MVVQTPPLPGPKSRMRKEEGWSRLYKTSFELTFDFFSNRVFLKLHFVCAEIGSHIWTENFQEHRKNVSKLS